MRVIGSREFQITYQRLEEPVKVVAMTGKRIRKVLGHFYPGETPPVKEEKDGARAG